MLLSKEERDKFAAYLDQFAESNELLAKQFDKTPIPQTAINMLAAKYRGEAVAAKVVANILRNTEDF